MNEDEVFEDYIVTRKSVSYERLVDTVDISSPECFAHLGNWKLLVDGRIGFAYRFGVKEGFGTKREPMVAFFHFQVPMVEGEYEPSQEECDRAMEDLTQVVNSMSQIYKLSNPDCHIVSILVPEDQFPEFIKRDLDKILGGSEEE